VIISILIGEGYEAETTWRCDGVGVDLMYIKTFIIGASLFAAALWGATFYVLFF